MGGKAANFIPPYAYSSFRTVLEIVYGKDIKGLTKKDAKLTKNDEETRFVRWGKSAKSSGDEISATTGPIFEIFFLFIPPR